MSNSEWNDVEANKLPERVKEMDSKDELPQNPNRKRIVVVGLGMVGIAFMCVLVSTHEEYFIVHSKIPSMSNALLTSRDPAKKL